MVADKVRALDSFSPKAHRILAIFLIQDLFHNILYDLHQKSNIMFDHMVCIRSQIALLVL